MTKVSKSQVSSLCGELDVRVGAFLNRPTEDDWPYCGFTPHAATRQCPGDLIVVKASSPDVYGKKAQASVRPLNRLSRRPSARHASHSSNLATVRRSLLGTGSKAKKKACRTKI